MRYFKCENLFSYYGEEAVLSLMATDCKTNDDFLFDKNGKRLLRVVSIYGANASGKSNIIKAIRGMLKNIAGSSDGQMEGMPCFLQEVESSQVYKTHITCEIELLVGDEIYRYKYVINRERVISEELLKRGYSQNEFVTVFIRSDDLEVFYNGDNGAISGLVVTAKQSPRNLFLQLICRTDVYPYRDIYEWCKNGLESFVIPKDDEVRFNDVYDKLDEDSFKVNFSDLVKKFDPTIINIRKSINSNEKTEKKDIFFERKKVSGEIVGFHINLESDGTQRLFDFYPSLRNVFEHGGLYLADDLDTKLHPWIVRTLVSMFHDPEINVGGAQLIFSTHSTACMNSNDLRLDELSFTEKNESGFSTIFRLEFDDEEMSGTDVDFGKYYLLGQFGAIPRNMIT